MPKKKRKQLSNKQILMITLCILGAGMLMLVASILLAPSAEPAPVAQSGSAVVEQGGTAQSGSGAGSASGAGSSAQQPAKPTQSAQTQSQGTTSPKPAESATNTKPAESSTSPANSAAGASASGSGASTSGKPGAGSGAHSSNTTASASSTGAAAQKPQASATAQTSASSSTQSATASSSGAGTTSSNSATATAPATSTTSTKPKSNGAKLVFVFDDAGHNLNQLEPFLKLPFKVVIAVLPGLPHSAEAAAAARKAGKQVILHQPMQAVNLSVDPGPSAIKPDMHTYEIEALVRKNLAEIGPVVGLNNHEGSLITATQSAIGAVLDVCQAENIFFLDSRTNAETKAPQAALERGMKIYERDIFLDNEPGRDDIIAMIKKGLAVADKKGHAIMIGHIWSDGLAAIISEMYPDLVAQGYVFTDISGLD